MPAPRKLLRRYEVPGTARFLTFSCYRRLKLFDNDRIKDLFVDRLTRTAVERDISILAWVVMPEHAHVVVASESTTMTAWLSALKRPFSIDVLRRWRALDAPILARLRDRAGSEHFWQAGGGHDRNVVGHELREKIRYCHQNPVKRGLAATSVDWAWSSARRYEANETAIGPSIAFDLVPGGSDSLT